MDAAVSTFVKTPTVKLMIGGKLVETKTTQWRDVVNPATQQVLSRVPFCTPEEVAAAKQKLRTLEILKGFGFSFMALFAAFGLMVIPAIYRIEESVRNRPLP